MLSFYRSSTSTQYGEFNSPSVILTPQYHDDKTSINHNVKFHIKNLNNRLKEVPERPSVKNGRDGRSKKRSCDVFLKLVSRTNMFLKSSVRQRIRAEDVCRFAASLGVRFARTQVTPRILKQSNALSGRCPKCCDVRRAKWLAYPYMQSLFEPRALKVIQEIRPQTVLTGVLISNPEK